MHLPRFEVPEGTNAVSYLRDLAEQGLRERYGSETPELRRRLEFELKTIEEMGFPDYFLIVWDFIRFARENGISVGPGRGSAAGSLVAYCLRITDLDPMQLHAAVRALPEPRPQEHAGHRRRLRCGRPRTGDQLRRREVRPPERRPDHHLRQDAAEGGDQGRRPGDGHPLRRGRPDRQDGARGAEGLVRRVHEAGRRAAQGVRRRRDGEEHRRHGTAAGGRRPQRLDPRRRRRHRRPAADRVPAAPAEGAGGRGRHAVLDERRRGAGSAEDGLPGPAQPRRDRPRARPDRVQLRPAAGHGRGAAGRRQDLRDAGPRRRNRRVPVRVVGDARGAARRQADALRGSDRAGRAVPAGADAEHPAVRRAQERARGGDVRRSAAGGRARRDLRHHRVPGAGDADQPRDRRLLARRSGRPAQGDRQEDRRADGDAQGQVHRGMHRKWRDARAGAAAVGRQRAVERLLVQQVTRRLLRIGRLPHRVAQGEPPGRVHGRPHLLGDVDQGPRAVLRLGVRRDGHRGAPAGRQLEHVRLRRGRGPDPIRPVGRQERG